MKSIFKFFLKLWTAVGVIILIPIIIILAIIVVMITGYSIAEVLWWGFVFSIIFAVPLSWIRKGQLKRAKKKLKKLESTETEE